MISTPKTRLTRQEKRTLRKYLYPLRGCDPTEADSGELRLLDPLVGTCKVVALGENSHGASEIFRMKERLIRYLTTRQEFDQVVFEAGMGEGVFLDNYIRRGIGTAKAAIFGLACGSGIHTRCCRSSNGCGSGMPTAIRSAFGASTCK